jgi:argininosuccinate lyase
VRTQAIAFGAAHAVASRLLAEWRQAPAAPPLAPILARVSAEVLGQPLDYPEADLAQILSARHFVDVRCTAGGPAPQETRRAVRQSQQQLEADRAWLATRRAYTAAAESRLRERSRAL